MLLDTPALPEQVQDTAAIQTPRVWPEQNFKQAWRGITLPVLRSKFEGGARQLSDDEFEWLCNNAFLIYTADRHIQIKFERGSRGVTSLAKMAEEVKRRMALEKGTSGGK